MKLRDNSGGIWGEIILKRKNPEVVLREVALPGDPRFARLMAEEAISAIKGSVKHILLVDRSQGKVQYRRVNAGNSYSTGILKRISPDGTPYPVVEEGGGLLKESTLRHREYKQEVGDTVTSRSGAFVLRETSQHIFNGLKVKEITVTRNGARAVIGWQGENEIIALKRNRQSETGASLWFGQIPKWSKTVEARPFIGLSQEFVDVFEQFVNQLAIK